ncbi:DUF6602 domain-containing protein [Nitrososphaera viennensis]|uniref:DUF6602 domain-containing protein n=2 Tax=Nitrososphaera viennensis TaxID=1034015 RepID=A0A060HMQ8_9ARCH|nr:DUF6602 domain-containing protein [Nitrososphaera viennensis]AIC14861.1 hypothetical protein NVIE_006570 [Nitrososphaera viennensis EN76]
MKKVIGMPDFTNSMNLGKIFDEISKKMVVDINETRKAIDKHPGLRGESFEEVVREFLEKYLPKAFAISKGFIVDSDGKQSKQLDVIISDAMNSPIFYQKGENRVLPVECVFAVIEVKARLDSVELDKAVDNMLSVRNLTKKAFRTVPSYQPLFRSIGLYGKEDWIGYPINYFVFAFDSIDLKHLTKLLDRKHKAHKLPEWSRIDGIYVLGKGMVTNYIEYEYDDNRIPPLHIIRTLPEPKSKVTSIKSRRSLLLFYQDLMDCLSMAEVKNFILPDYTYRLRF